ncbi:hypothetical protein NA57DRAFT_71173 [Rhizodiscina lignyota]|uniref:Uncharacterized protein n=1 Tax=Rhizodiscina lignyota TaxID=1504668 RepID=A0A9P4IRU7_9PEZI|nr:hypothetical protein NA57DRAFT_71173 [Rhizodiscina lignyota]
MAPVTTDGAKAENPKRSKWNPFSKDKQKSDEIKPENPTPATANTNQNNYLRPSTDSAYGSSEQSNSLTTSEGGASGQLSSKQTNNASGGQPTTPTGQQNHEVPVNGNLNHTGPTIKREVRNAGNDTSVTTVTTTTTTTTIVTGPNGSTTIQEPRAELPDGRTTPQPSQSEAVQNAINERGNDTGTTGVASQAQKQQRRRSLTPGQRPIPERDPGLLSPIGPRQSQDEPAQNSNGPAIPSRSPHRHSFLERILPSNDNQSQNQPAPSATSPQQSHNFSYPRQSRLAPNQTQNQPVDSVPQQLRPGEAPGSTRDNLKTAAAGIHGVAETLRGTIASEADRRLRVGRATEADYARNQEIVNSGRQEIETGNFSRHTKDNAVSVPFSQARKPVAGVDQDGRPANGYRQPSPQDANSGAPVDGNTRPQSWGTGWAGQPENTSGSGRGGKLDKWLHKASSHPSERSGTGGGDLKQERERTKLRRRSGGLRTLNE